MSLQLKHTKNEKNFANFQAILKKHTKISSVFGVGVSAYFTCWNTIIAMLTQQAVFFFVISQPFWWVEKEETKEKIRAISSQSFVSVFQCHRVLPFSRLLFGVTSADGTRRRWPSAYDYNTSYAFTLHKTLLSYRPAIRGRNSFPNYPETQIFGNFLSLRSFCRHIDGFLSTEILQALRCVVYLSMCAASACGKYL